MCVMVLYDEETRVLISDVLIKMKYKIIMGTGSRTLLILTRLHKQYTHASEHAVEWTTIMRACYSTTSVQYLYRFVHAGVDSFCSVVALTNTK